MVDIDKRFQMRRRRRHRTVLRDEPLVMAIGVDTYDNVPSARMGGRKRSERPGGLRQSSQISPYLTQPITSAFSI